MHLRLLLLTASCAAALLAPTSASADSLYIDSESHMPASVDAERFYGLVSEVASRWDVGIDGESEYQAGYRNGEQTIGFSEDIDSDVLGVTTWWARAVYTYRYKKVCRRTSSGRKKCHRKKKRVFLYDEVVEQDVALATWVPWQQGPAYPTAVEYDLETTLLHELGHFADPAADNHVYGCENSPMIDVTAPGEWWRDSDDWLRFGCLDSTGPRYKRDGRDYKRFEVVRHRLPAVVMDESERRGPDEPRPLPRSR
jgi:hypothetical protein